MPSLKDLKNRINSVKSTRKITKAMQMVAAAKLRKAQEAAEKARPYSDRMSAVMANLTVSAQGSDDAPKLLAGTGKDQVHLLIVATAERGLCGAFNSSIVKLAREEAYKLKSDGREVKILCVGRKGLEQLKREFADNLVADPVQFPGVKSIGYAHARSVSERVLAMFEAGEFDVCTLFFAQFKSVISQTPTAQQLIPASFEGEADDGEASASRDYEYEPSEVAILEKLLPQNITTQIFRALLENAASEQGARMSAMDNATRNAGDMIDKLTLQYNRSRQAAVTSELIEIISGAEAL